MKDYSKELDNIIENGRILSEKDMETVNGAGSNGYWPVLEEGDREFECLNDLPGHKHNSMFHYAIEDIKGVQRIHVTGICSVCGCKNNYVIWKS